MQFQLSETFQLLLLAHLLADFVFHPNTMAVNKMHSNKVLFLHALIAGLTTYVIVFDFTAWVTPLLVVATHWVIDKIKIIVMEKKFETLSGARLFVIDQLCHIATLFLIIIFSFLLINVFNFSIGFASPVAWSPYARNKILPLLFAILFAGPVASTLIAKMLEPFTPTKGATLMGGGKLIGYLERYLIIIFILFQQWECIGFLIAAKTLLRFKEAKAGRKRAEYVLLGTLLSVFIAILCGVFLLASLIRLPFTAA